MFKSFVDLMNINSTLEKNISFITDGDSNIYMPIEEIFHNSIHYLYQFHITLRKKKWGTFVLEKEY